MSDNSNTSSKPKQASSIRLLVYVDGYGWIPIGFMRGTAIPRKKLYLPEFAGKTIRAAIAIVGIVKRKPVALNHVKIENWKIDEDGYANYTDQLHHDYSRMIVNSKLAVAEIAPDEEDVLAIKRCLSIF